MSVDSQGRVRFRFDAEIAELAKEGAALLEEEIGILLTGSQYFVYLVFADVEGEEAAMAYVEKIKRFARNREAREQ